MTIQEHLAAGHIPYSNGVEVKQLTHFPDRSSDFKWVGIINGSLETWTEDGRYHHNGPRNRDLTWEPKEVTLWVNVYEGTAACHYPTKVAALQHANDRMIAIAVPLTFTPKI